MAGKVILVPKTMNPEIYSQVVQYCRNVAEVRKIAYEPETGLMDLEELKEQLAKKNVAAVFFENPTYLGNFETRGEEIAKLAHDAGAYCVVQTEVAALGIMESPVNQGADIVCGDIQPLGMHIQFGGGQAGFIACNQNMDLVEQFPTYMYGITETEKEDTYGGEER